MISFSGALDPGAARMLGDYQLATVVKAKKSRAHTGKAVKLISATYDPSRHTVTLTPRGKVPATPLQLTIIAAKTLDAEGRPIDGDHDGQPGGNFQTTLRKAATCAAVGPSDRTRGSGHRCTARRRARRHDLAPALPANEASARSLTRIRHPAGRAEHPTERPVSPTPRATRYTRRLTLPLGQPGGPPERGRVHRRSQRRVGRTT